jgi:hypothetical protein
MATPMFFYAGVYDSGADAELDYNAIKALHDSGAIGSYDSAIIVHHPDGDLKVTQTEKPPALVVISIDDVDAVERGAEHARTHTLKREFGDWDEAEQAALDSIARAEQQHAVA